MSLEGLTQIGKIINTRGLRGELKVKALTATPDAYAKLGSIILVARGKSERLKVRSSKMAKGFWWIQLEGVTTCEEAELLKNAELYLPDDEILPLEDDEFFIHDLIKAEVYSTEGEYLGKITDYFETGANGVCEVKKEKKSFLFPTTKEVLIEVKSWENKVIIQVLPGMID